METPALPCDAPLPEEAGGTFHRFLLPQNGVAVRDLDEGGPCDREEIRIPGHVQPHGFLLALDIDLEQVVLASENAEDFLHVPLKLILGSPPELLFEKELLTSLQMLRGSRTAAGVVNYLGAFRVGGELCSMVTHCVGGRRIVEFEMQDRLLGAEMMNSVITNFVAKLSQLATEAELCQVITRQIQDLTGFDRVLLYRFDAEGDGTVLAEENNGLLPSYLGLRFPASDIPTQARALYLANTVRIIPDANYTPVPLAGMAGEEAGQLDMSCCALRSVSPVHVEYMRNMRTMSSMSVSVVREGKLWGLISVHHAAPRRVPMLIRSACDMLTKMAAAHLNAFRIAAELRTALHMRGLQRNILTQIAAENNYLAGLGQQMDSLMDVTGATGVVLAVDGRISCAGRTPDAGTLRRLIDWLDTRRDLELYQTDRLGAELPWMARFAALASGLLAIRFSDLGPRYILWFRSEIVQTVRWAGEPVKTVDEAMSLHPRLSFQAWKETVRGQGQPWSVVELESAHEFRGALTTISLRRSEEEVAVSEARFNQLTQVLPIKVFSVTDDGELTYVNPRWRLEGFGNKGLWYAGARLVPEDAARCALAWEQAVAEEADFEEEVRFVCPETGTESWTLIRLIPFRREGAKRAGWIGSCIDLTERKQRETALRLAEKLTLTGRLTSFLAHEINNPLAAITNTLYLLRQKLGISAEAMADFATIDDELARISTTVQQTLRWNSNNSDKPTWTSAGLLFEDVLKLFSTKMRNRSVQIAVDGDPNVQIYGSAGQIRQVVAHLISNALDAVPVGGRVWTRAEQLLNEVEVLVGDAGTGMDKTEQGAIFRPFYSTKGDLGNGLGLYIANEIVERHGGRFIVESAVGSGTIMRMRLPTAAR